MARSGSNVRPDISDKDIPAIKRLCIVKFAAAVFEFANCWDAQSTSLAAGVIKTPLVRLGVVKAERKVFDMTGGGAISFEFHQIGAAIPDLADDRSTVKINPGRGPSQWMQKSRSVRLPGTNLEIKIVLPVPFCEPWLRFCFRCI